MHPCRFLILFLLAGWPALPLWGKAQASGPLTLEQCLAIALGQNPLIGASDQEHRAALERINQATAFPNPVFEYNSDLQPQPFNFVRSKESYIGAAQTFEYPGKRVLRGRIASQEAGQLAADIDLVKLDIVFQVKEAFYGMLLAQEMLHYAELDRELAGDFLGMAELKYNAGDIPKVEVARARVEALKAANAMAVASSNIRLARARLNFWMAQPKDSPLEIVGSLRRPPSEIDLGALKSEALRGRPEFRKTDMEVAREKLLQEQSRLSTRPDFDVAFSQHRLSNEPSTWSFTVSVPLPFLFKQRQRSELAEAEINIAALRKKREHLENNIALEVEEAHTNAATALRQIRLLEDEILPEAEEVHEMFLFSFREGEISGIELIEARKTLNEARKSYAEALFYYAATLASLDRAVGRMP